MRILLRVAAVCVAAVTFALLAVFCWFRFYTRDLPDISSLAQFAPTRVTQVCDSCLKTTVTAIPYEQIGANLRSALNAAEGGTNTLTVQISRIMFCTSSKQLTRELDELRVAQQLKRQFSPQQLLVIYANRLYFGEGTYGVQAAAQHLFRRNAGELSIAEAALIAGIIRSPSRFSPYEHPDRALQRRNQIIDAMFASGSITVEEDKASKSAALGIVEAARMSPVQ